ncbi:MAG: hypothetical protein RLZZ136_640 [Pseudomonadota bacterium]
MSQFEDRFWSSRDGLRLHYRDYPGAADRLPVVCLHGLTRNARDFANLAGQLSGARRVLVPDMRGRGDSAYAKDPESYNTLQYIDDLQVLLAEQGIDRFIAVGTSMGGLMSMIMAVTMPERIAAAVLNDIGPELSTEGLDKIRDYVGQGRTFPTWMHAARALEEEHGPAFPQWQFDDWLAQAKRVMTLSGNGRIVFDYDMKIAEPFLQLDFTQQPDLWPAFAALAAKPVLVVRGGISELFAAETCVRMGRSSDQVECVTVPQVGHAPTLDEPEAVAGIARLLARAA